MERTSLISKPYMGRRETPGTHFSCMPEFSKIVHHESFRMERLRANAFRCKNSPHIKRILHVHVSLSVIREADGYIQPQTLGG